ncbi:transcription factor E2F6 [Bombina bombina]|uniref:transcription factor E2F6 n=1 Tax=Bombina bombina TaxID=8345 RepID=UPI00235ACCE9|nr:transcription factor E2F6 [Bombina bombina]
MSSPHSESPSHSSARTEAKEPTAVKTDQKLNIPKDDFVMTMKRSLKLPRPRFDVSLFYLTRKFMDLIRVAPEGILDLNDVAKLLGVRKRRVYDITNVLDGINLVQKKSKNLVQWIGADLTNAGTKVPEQQRLQNELSDLSTMEEGLDELIRDCANQLFRLTEDKINMKLAYVTYQDLHNIKSYNEQIVLAIKAPEETKLEVPHPTNKSIGMHIKSTKGPIDVYLCEIEDKTENSFEQLTKTVKMETETILIDDD